MILKITALSTLFFISQLSADLTNVGDILKNYCLDCHDADTQKGKIRLDDFSKMSLNARLDLLNKMQEQIHFKEMPPKKKKKQPSVSERSILANWLAGVLNKHSASKLEDKLRYADYGNYVDHQKLFSGEIEEKAYTLARRWLVSPQIFHERVMNIFKLEGRDRDTFKSRSFYGVTNPFVLNDAPGVRYYDNATLDGGHLLVMLTNAEWISQKQIFASRQKHEKATIENPKDKWYPRTTPEAFDKIIAKKAKASDAEMKSAIETQFKLVLNRLPDEKELAKYMSLSKTAIDIAGNSEGLRQMLKAVILESEFLYRIEFGAGQTDKFGRKKLSPHEAAFAISYALGDRGPDDKLMKAAIEGNLLTEADYKREVTRLLNDKKYYSNQIDPAICGKHGASHSTSHPKINRFFREFFGYPSAVKVFKDVMRGDGYYQNPGRGTAGTPGHMVNEADMIVDWYLMQDKKVFENLLTTEKFFVYRTKDPKKSKKVMAEWQEIYEKLKNTEWRKDPAKVLEENKDYLAKFTVRNGSIQLHQKRPIQDFAKYMYFFEESFGKGRKPFVRVPWSHGYYLDYSRFYSLAPTPPRSRYIDAVSKKTVKTLKEKEFWDYPIEQPFKIPNRKGILTHPAWLIANSHNAETDPVKRGKWIREKLLAGRVPDVPITVDAKVPEDPHKTLRERFDMVTQKPECWKCHERMNPLGNPFEMFDDFGRYRTQENLEYEENIIAKPTHKYGSNTYKTKPVNAKGLLSGTKDKSLDGEVTNALDLIDRLAMSERVRQSIIRHAFRFYMGRNEMLADSQTLIDADNAYVKSGGSFKAVIISLLTSDSFIYRK
ncbi:MAG: DUF1588 domain-containing protein [Lentisphaeraceae bacterium]|nr:DUF1588 domain-containing protein [Lentisphaeraceae bacterium]